MPERNISVQKAGIYLAQAETCTQSVSVSKIDNSLVTFYIKMGTAYSLLAIAEFLEKLVKNKYFGKDEEGKS